MKKTFFSILTLFITIYSIAGIYPQNSRKTGAQISQGATFAVEDFDHNCITNNTCSDIELANSTLLLKLWLEESVAIATTPFELTVDYKVTLYPGGHIQTGSLNIDYTNEGQYTDIDYEQFVHPTSSIHYTKAEVEVLGISNAVPSNVHLDIILETEKYKTLSDELPIVKYDGIGYQTGTNELQIYWPHIEGAESYDIEWLFIDAPGASLLPHLKSYDFDFKNATRINTPNLFYNISLAYPEGFLIFRARAVQNKLNGNREEGEWSYPTKGVLEPSKNFEYYQQSNATTFEWTPSYAYAGLEHGRNWQYTVTYAEHGKRKEVINYFDPSLRSRQQVTVLSSDNTAVVGETVYDYVGRPAVNVLPSPQQNKGIRFYANQTKSPQSGLFGYQDFDIDSKFENPNPIDSINSEGGAHYYSKSNNSPFGINSQYTPTANGYAYTRTQYLNDGTNRPKKQSGIGNTFKISSGKETKYLYAKPVQEELDRLFGNEAGYASMYKKNAVVDPNGQVSVSYIDNYGRTIATALSGSTPSNLEEIDTKPNQFDVITTNLSNENQLDANGNMMVSSAINVTQPTTYNFSYQLDSSSMTFGCLGNTPCKYDYIIFITDEYGDKVPFTSNDTMLVATGITYQQAVNFAVNFTDIGTYKIHKILKLNTDHIAGLVQAMLDNNACLTVEIDSITACNPTCEEACRDAYVAVNASGDTTYFNDFGDVVAVIDSNGTVIQYGQNFNQSNALDTIDYIRNQISICVDSCINIDSYLGDGDKTPCEIKYDILAADMSPGGQYFDNIPIQDTDPTYYEQNRYNKLIEFMNATNEFADYIELAGCLGVSNNSDTVAFWQNIHQNWSSSFADVLVRLHPEFCAFKNECCSLIKDCEAEEYCNAPYIPNQSTITTYLTNYLGTGYDITAVAQDTLMANYPTPNSTINSIYDLLHGTNGVISSGIMTSADFIAATTSFFTEYEKYNYIKTGCTGLYLDGTNGITTDGFIIRYPKNPVFENYTPPMPNIADFNQGIIDLCDQKAEEYTNNFMDNFECIGLVSDTAALRAFILGEMTTNCSNLDAYNKDMNYKIANYLDGIGVEASCMYSLWPEEAEDNCNCDQFIEYLADYYDKQIEDIATDIQNYALNVDATLFNELLDSTDLANGFNQTTIWSILDQCNNLTYIQNNISQGGNQLNVPSYFSCPDDSTAIDTNSCITTLNDLAYQNALEVVRAQALDSISKYRAAYLNHCFHPDTILNRETFTMSYTLEEYHYTLFYYDQAGNLIKTVPPSGVYQENESGVVLHNSILNATQIETVQKHRAKINGYAFTVPAHTMVTNYKYNSLNQLTSQNTPDGGSSVFFYDALGRLIASQNAEQLTRAAYSYTLYDALGRNYQAGELVSTTPLDKPTAIDATDFLNRDIVTTNNPFLIWVKNATSRNEVIETQYNHYNTNSTIPITPKNLRNRIAHVKHFDDYNSPQEHVTASYYTYDINGNVNTIIQENKNRPNGHQLKRIDYEYDLVSGNVNKVIYQADQNDRFYHKYEYDADNRLKVAYSSRNGIVWEKEAKYFYYPHGPLARVELGDKQVQAKDYAYTIHGWLKAINSSTGTAQRDMGEAGVVGTQNEEFAQDVYGVSLHYYSGDYQAIGSAANSSTIVNTSNITTNDLYNGNISKMITALSDENENKLSVHGNGYTYDALNRIKTSNVWKDDAGKSVLANNTFINATNNGDYRSTYKYDGNGNISYLKRNGYLSTETDALMDEFTYIYDLSSGYKTDNKLYQVQDAISATNYESDIDNQGANNYQYDDLGRLIKDVTEEIETIKWNVSNKVVEIVRTSGSSRPNVKFQYDPLGNRVAKEAIYTNGDRVVTHYALDAQGNPMATYKENIPSGEASSLSLKEFMIYGSSRLGVKTEDVFLIDPNLLSLVNIAGLGINNGEIIKETGTSWWNGGASSASQLNGDGYVKWTLDPNNNSNVDIALGLSYTDASPSLYTINYAWHTSSIGAGTKIYENGSYKSSHGSYTGGTELMLRRSNNGTTLEYLKDGVVVATRTNLSSNPMVVDMSLKIQNQSKISSLELHDNQTGTHLTLTGSSGAINDLDLTYRELDNKSYELTNHLGNVLQTISDRKLRPTSLTTTSLLTSGSMATQSGIVFGANYIERSASGSSWGGAGCSSNASISGDGYVEFEAKTQTANVMMGLSFNSPNHHYNTIAYALYYITGDRLVVYENGSLKMTTAVSDGDICRVMRVGNKIRYYRNNELLREVEETNTANMIADFTFYQAGARIYNPKIVDVEYQHGSQYLANVTSYSGYYPFGMLMSGRNGGEDYRYSFQGQETDDEVKGKGNSVNYKYRMHDPRLGRFFAVDPLSPSYPELTPYQFSHNSPIGKVEIEGLEGEWKVDIQHAQNDVAKLPVGTSRSASKEVFNSSMAKLQPFRDLPGGFHESMDALGFVPVVGEVFDGTNILVYSYEGDYLNAAISSFALVPLVGDASAKGFKYSLKAAGYSTKKFKSLRSAKRWVSNAMEYGFKSADAIQGGSAQLRKALNLTDGTIQAHHIIPVEALKKSDIVQKAVDAGFDFNGITNGIGVKALKEGGQHANHPSYTKNVLNQIEEWATANPNYTGEDAMNYLNELSGDLKTLIQKESVEGGKKVNDLDF